MFAVYYITTFLVFMKNTLQTIILCLLLGFCSDFKNENGTPFLMLVSPSNEVVESAPLNDEPEIQEPATEEIPPTWYQLGWVYVLGNRDQIIYEAEIDEWNIEGFKMQAELMNHFKDPNCPCKAVWFPL